MLRVHIIKKTTKRRLIQRSCRKVSANVSNDITEQSNKTEHDGFCGESFADNGELLASLTPLLFSMKLFGVYYDCKDRHHRRTADPEGKPASSSISVGSGKLRVCATIFLVFAWFNVLRFISAFTATDNFGALLIMKISLLLWYGLIAIMHTAYYVASHSGQLLAVLLSMPVTRDCVTSTARTVKGLTTFSWITVAMKIIVGTYFVFSNNAVSDMYDVFLYTPFVTHIDIPVNKIILARIVNLVFESLITPGMILAQSMNAVLVYIFYHQYKQLKKNFCRALGERGQFSADFSTFRRRHQTRVAFGQYCGLNPGCAIPVQHHFLLHNGHQTLSRAVSTLDGFMKISNVGGFVCQIASIILILYSLIFYSESMEDAITGASYTFWLGANGNGLLFAATCGVVVNHMVCVRIVGIKLANWLIYV